MQFADKAGQEEADRETMPTGQLLVYDDIF
jgi:hypothetical protein